MRADVVSLEILFHESKQWVVPVYQRHYEWERGEGNQLHQFWEDWIEQVEYRLNNQQKLPHYFGSLIFSYEESQNQPYGTVRQAYLVDGQQRITTFQLALMAVREVAREFHELALVQTINAYIFNPESPGMIEPTRETFKLWPSDSDRDLYLNIAKNTPKELQHFHKDFFYKKGSLKKNIAPKLLLAFWDLYEKIKIYIFDQKAPDKSPEYLLNLFLLGFLSGFQIVVIILDQNDDAQEIFASLNGLGKPLSPFDLIRNDIFHRAQRQGEDTQKVYELWKPFEQESFWLEEVKQGRYRRARTDHLITHAVVAQSAREVNVGKIAIEYQHYARDNSFRSVLEELNILLAHAETYRAIEQANSNTTFTKFTNVLQAWDIFTFHPLILWVESQPFEVEDKTKFYEICESYIVRREICGLSIKNYNKVVTGIIRNGNNSSNLVSATLNYLSKLEGDSSKMPNDSEVEKSFMLSYSYSPGRTKRIKYILLQIEYAKHTRFSETTIQSNDLTIEHIMPRTWSKHWPLPDGSSAPCDTIWQTKLHGYTVSNDTRELMEARELAIDSMGNLTLLNSSLNPSAGNAEWTTKKLSYENSLLFMNKELTKLDEWNESTIKHRAKDLAKVATEIWKMPNDYE